MKKLTTILLASALVACIFPIYHIIAMEIWSGTPEERVEYEKLRLGEEITLEEFDDVFGTVLVRNITTHGTLSAQGNASSSFGNSIVPSSDNSYDLGYYGSAWRNIYASGSIIGATLSDVSGDLDPDTNNAYDIGEYDLAWKDIYASGTIYVSSVSSTIISVIASSNVATTTINANYGGLIMERTVYSSASNTALVTDQIIAMTSASTSTITLPTAGLLDGRTYHIVDEAGTGAIGGPKYIETEGAETISGEDSDVITGNYNAVSVYSDGSNWYKF